MLRLWGVLGLALAFAVGAFAADRPDRVMGNWQGRYMSEGGSTGPLTAKIIAEGEGHYRAILEAEVDGEKYAVELAGYGDGSVAVFQGKVLAKPEASEDERRFAPTVQAMLGDGKFDGRVLGMGEPVKLEMRRVELKPPSLGQAPPEGAVMLFDGANQDLWVAAPPKWNLHDGMMEVSGCQLLTRDEYGSGKYHIEFRTPFMPAERGQGRGNSGVYVLGRYEVQVLDSFGLPPADNEAGGIYKMALPKVNASLPPGEWQTYDITFTAAQFDASGIKTQDATISVEHNGILIHDNVKLSAPTPGGVADKDAPQGPLLLQNHGNPVAYRNIWFQPANP